MALIAQALAWLATPAPLAARQTGYVGEAVATLARARRCRSAWAEHLAYTRGAIVEGTTDLAGGHCLVLGSGGLLDIPALDLAARFDRVWLLDLVHPWRTRRLARRAPTLKPTTADIAGVLGELAKTRPRPAGLGPAWRTMAPDAVISANGLSQLPIKPVEALKARGATKQAAERLGGAIVDRHLADLAAFRAAGSRVVLVTDVSWTAGPAGGDADTAGDPIHGRHLPPGVEWDWWLAPPGELAGGRWQCQRVRALIDPDPSALIAAAAAGSGV